MSHAMGIVYSKDHKDILGYFEYNGTSDVACSKIQDIPERVSYNWRKDGALGKCDCLEGNHIPVILFTYYGDGFEWESEYCPKCMVITGQLDPFPNDDWKYYVRDKNTFVGDSDHEHDDRIL
jgi:hypothetical protein